MKRTVRVVGLMCVLVSVGAFLPLSSTASFTSQDMGTYILWSQDSTHTYFQQYKADYSWKDSTTTNPSGFNYMGKLGDLSTLLFDGAGHQFVDNNYSYSFNGSSGVGVWQNVGLNVTQYAYDYNSGQWWNQGNWGGWQTLGSTGLTTAFMGDSTSHTLGNNWSYLFDGTYGIWKNGNMNNVTQYAYNYTTGNWYDQGNWGGWATLGSNALSASFVGDTTSHTLGNNWSYLFDGTYGYWNNGNMNNVTQYAYNYTTGNWYDQGNWGGWATLGSNSLSASFVGDTTSHTLGNNWSYLFDGTYGYWNNGNMNNVSQYVYNYTTGNWYDQGNWGGWAILGPASLSASFVGDGAWHTSSTWGYMYDGTYGNFKNVGMNLNEFAYNYSSGQWWDEGQWGGWATLGPASLSATFLADGSRHYLDTNWSYQYLSGPNVAGWFNSAGATTYPWFQYDYAHGQWVDYGGTGTGVNYFGAGPLGIGGLSAVFMGDGAQHTLGNNWSYLFFGGQGFWYNGSGLMELAYSYSTGQWYYNPLTSWVNDGLLWQLGSGTMSPVFLGDGGLHDLKNGWGFALQNGLAEFYRGGVGGSLRFSYNPSGAMSNMWFVYDGASSANMSGFDSSIGLSWMTDGQTHFTTANPNSYCFAYNYGSDEVAFYANVSGSPLPFLKYSWSASRWFDSLAGAGAWILLPAGPAPQIGDYMPWGPGSGNTIPNETIFLYSQYSDPVEAVAIANTGTWGYHYATGEWDWYDLATGIMHSNVDSGGPDKHR